MDCATKYPILLLHGFGYRDRFYWGRIPAVLRKRGAAVYFGNQDGNAVIADNADYLVSVIDRILEETGAEKVNIIAHSKGGLEARYLASSLGQAERIASITTLSTPHYGSVTVGRLLTAFPDLIRFGCRVVDVFRKACGDQKPQTLRSIEEMKPGFMKQFNAENPDIQCIFYASYASVMRHWYNDLLLSIPYLVVKRFEGDNDGLVAPQNACWTNFHLLQKRGWRGLSHADMVDFYRLSVIRKNKDKRRMSDITQLYIDITADLKRRGL